MNHISIIVPNGNAVLSSIIGSYKIFRQVNEYLKMTGQRDSDRFEIELVGITGETNLYEDAFAVRPTKHIDEIERTDLIIVTTIIGDLPTEIENNRPFVEWIRKMHNEHQTEVASLCLGAFLLAETGLLDGKSCATHWSGEAAFRANFPNVNLMTDKIITEDGGIYTSGGAYSFLNLILYLVEKYCGFETAVWCSKMFEIEIDRDNQGQFIIFNGQKDHNDEPIREAQVFIEENFGEKLTVDHIASKFALSRRNFVRRFKKATANTPLEYIQRVKIEAAKKRFETSADNVTEVMYNVGYNDTKSFRELFRKHTGLTPSEYRTRYNRLEVAV